MRGVTLCVGADEKPLWCPLVYEFLSDFCYTCGIIGHTDRVCGTKLKKDEAQQYSKALRFIPEKRRGDEGAGERNLGGKLSLPWRAGGSDSRGSSGSGSWGGRSGRRAGSDAPSWRKPEENQVADQKHPGRDEEEVTSPIKPVNDPKGGELAKRGLFKEKDKEEKMPTAGDAKGVGGWSGKEGDDGKKRRGGTYTRVKSLTEHRGRKGELGTLEILPKREGNDRRMRETTKG
jgi:hypothetical protein